MINIMEGRQLQHEISYRNIRSLAKITPRAFKEVLKNNGGWRAATLRAVDIADLIKDTCTLHACTRHVQRPRVVVVRRP